MRRPTLPVRSAPRPVSVTRRTSGDTAAIIVRAAGDRQLGAITQMGSEADDCLGGNFIHRPPFGDFAAIFQELARALQAGDAAAAAERRALLEAAGIEVWHSVHDMRIDEPGSLAIAGGRARFRANAAFLMMRTGGLG